MEDKKFDVATTQQGGPAALIQAAISGGADLDKLEKLLELQERWEANEAKKAFYEAKANFKAEMPLVFKDKENKQYSSMYASEAALMNTVNPALGKFGLEAHFDFPPATDKLLTVKCILSHRMGHIESVSLPGPYDSSGTKNPLQQLKSTLTYLRKATFEAVIGIATTDKDADDDGNSSGGIKYITEEQQNELHASITDNMQEGYLATFLSYTGKQGWGYTLDKISAKNLAKVKTALNSAIKKRKEASK
jgi:hypothetical protein